MLKMVGRWMILAAFYISTGLFAQQNTHPGCVIRMTSNDVRVGVGHVQFVCRCPGATKFVWRFNFNHTGATVILNDTHNDHSMLKLNSPTQADSGVYSCTAHIPPAQYPTLFTSLNVVWDHLRLTAINQLATVGDDVTLTCRRSGFPQPIYSWFRLPLEGGSSYLGHKESTKESEEWTSLTLNSVKANDSGTYRCMATNRLETIYADVRLDVCTPLKPVLGGLNATARVGDSVRLECSFDSQPAPRYRWFFLHNATGTLLTDAVTDHGVSVLRIVNVSSRDVGAYVCEGSNGLYVKNSTRYRLDVFEPPEVKLSETRVTLGVNQSVVVNCSATGNPPPTLQWRFQQTLDTDALPISDIPGVWANTDHHSLHITHAQLKHQGFYECIAISKTGEAFAFVNVTVA